ncbi:hypothetical protein [Paenibacillus sp.]|jgi:hypothetical protein|nr:hypothetical protein [Paenibacillus sp.]MDR0266639.1 hypothetical protein [Paenibacillus sp.]
MKADVIDEYLIHEAINLSAGVLAVKDAIGYYNAQRAGLPLAHLIMLKSL